MMQTSASSHLVIFGCGYVGTAFAREALRRGMRVTALTRNAPRAGELRALGLDVIEGELADHAWHPRIAPADWVLNTVSAADPTPEGYRRSYVDGMRSILAWAAGLERPVGTFLYTSSTGVYLQGGGAEVDETASTAHASVTGRILVEAEDLLRAAPATAVARWFILRLAGIYGPGRHYLLNALRAGTTQFGGSPAFRMNLAHRDDIVAALFACAEAPPTVANETCNVSDGAPATKQDLLAWLAHEIGAPAPGFDGAATGSARKGGDPTPDRIIRSEKLRRLVGWQPRHADFRAGYRAILGREV